MGETVDRTKRTIELTMPNIHQSGSCSSPKPIYDVWMCRTIFCHDMHPFRSCQHHQMAAFQLKWNKSINLLFDVAMMVLGVQPRGREILQSLNFLLSRWAQRGVFQKFKWAFFFRTLLNTYNMGDGVINSHSSTGRKRREQIDHIFLLSEYVSCQRFVSAYLHIVAINKIRFCLCDLVLFTWYACAKSIVQSAKYLMMCWSAIEMYFDFERMTCALWSENIGLQYGRKKVSRIRNS